MDEVIKRLHEVAEGEAKTLTKEEAAAILDRIEAQESAMADDLVEQLRSIGDLWAAEGSPDFGLLYKAADRIEALMAERQWQPIETAPEDGTAVLVCRDLHGQWRHTPMCVARFLDGFWRSPGQTHYVSPAHWIPLPQPPVKP